MRIIFTIAYIKYNLIYAARNLTVKLLRRRALFLWRQGDTSSLCLFSKVNGLNPGVSVVCVV